MSKRIVTRTVPKFNDGVQPPLINVKKAGKGDYLGRHLECIQANSASCVDVRMVDGCEKTNLRRIAWVAVGDCNLQLESAYS